MNLKFASASEFVEEVVKEKDNIPPPGKLTENMETLFDFDDSSWEKSEIVKIDIFICLNIILIIVGTVFARLKYTTTLQSD